MSLEQRNSCPVCRREDPGQQASPEPMLPVFRNCLHFKCPGHAICNGACTYVGSFSDVKNHVTMCSAIRVYEHMFKEMSRSAQKAAQKDKEICWLRDHLDRKELLLRANVINLSIKARNDPIAEGPRATAPLK